MRFAGGKMPHLKLDITTAIVKNNEELSVPGDGFLAEKMRLKT